MMWTTIILLNIFFIADAIAFTYVIRKPDDFYWRKSAQWHGHNKWPGSGFALLYGYWHERKACARELAHAEQEKQE